MKSGSIKVINVSNWKPYDDGNEYIHFYIGRSGDGNVLGNPFTHIKSGTLAQYVVSDRDTAIEKYKQYFDESYQNNPKFKAKIDEIYDAYVSGKNIHLECFCAPKPCHGDIIKLYIEKKFLNDLQK